MKRKPAAIVAPADRPAALKAEQRLKMAASAHAYVRGSTTRFYEWLDAAPRPTIPDGPPIWICGDCHVGNLGPVASAPDSKGNHDLAIQIRDLDQTVIGNPAHDLIRLALSLAMAARSSDLPGVTTARMLERMIDGYEAAFHPSADSETVPRASGEIIDDIKEMPTTVRRVMRAAAGRSWRHLADERIEGVARNIPLGKRFWPLTPDERAATDALFAQADTRALATTLRSRPDSAKDDTPEIRVVDAAFWRKGCSSLGLLRLAVLVVIGSGRNERHCLMDVKQAAAPIAPPRPDHPMPTDDAERVVTGARALSPFLGTRMLAAHLLGQPVFIRELLPQDLKLEIEHLSIDEAMRVAEFLAHIVGRAHARQMPEADRARWITDLQRNRSTSLDAPSWLWRSMVDLVATHESAYLDHCRRYALQPA